MRITNNLLIHNMLWNMNNNLVSMNEKQTQLSTGKRIHKPSDDPVGVTSVIKVKADIAENTQYKENVRDAKSWLDVSENSLMDTKDIFQRIRELAVQGANGTNTDEETSKIASEIDQLTEEIIVNANSTMAGRYIFSGFQTDEKLLNDDGTYNIDITSEKTSDFKSIAYEVAVGESLQVGTNYLNVYGAVQEDTIVTNTFTFGSPRYKQAQGNAATHTKMKTPVDFSKNMTGTPTTITVDGVVYTVDVSKLDGTLKQEEYAEVISSAIQTTPAGAATLGSVADVYFVPSADESNKDGELVVEVKKYGATGVLISSGTDPDVFMTNPQKKSGEAAIPPVKSSISGTFDRAVDLTTETLNFTIGGMTYIVDTSGFDASPSISNAELITAVENATAADGSGEQLKNIMDVSFATTAGTQGTLALTAKSARTEIVDYTDSGSGFVAPATETDGVSAKSAVKANVDFIVDLSSDLATGSETLTIDFGVTTYHVDTATIDGSITPENFVTLIEGAVTPAPPAAPTGTLGADYDVSFSLHEGTVGTLTVTPKLGGAGNFTIAGTGATNLAVNYPIISAGVDATNAVVTGTEEITDAMFAGSEGDGVQSFVVTYNDETKRIDVNMSTISNMADLTTEINNQLQEAFGVNGDPPPTNNVTFDIYNNGSKDVVRFTGDAKEDGSRTTLKVDVIMSNKPQMIQDLEDFSVALNEKNDEGISKFLGQVDDHLDNVSTTLADIGAKDNRLTFIENRIDDNNIAMTEILSKVQDINYAEVTIQFKSLESIYRASLSVGAKVIQPTLMDFIQ